MPTLKCLDGVFGRKVNGLGKTGIKGIVGPGIGVKQPGDGFDRPHAFHPSIGGIHGIVHIGRQLLGDLQRAVPGPGLVVPGYRGIVQPGGIKEVHVVKHVAARGQEGEPILTAFILVNGQHFGDERADIHTVSLNQRCEVHEQAPHAIAGEAIASPVG